MVDNIPLLRHWFRYTAKSYASGIAAAGRFVLRRARPSPSPSSWLFLSRGLQVSRA